MGRFYRRFRKKFARRYKKKARVSKAVRKYVKKQVVRKMEPKVLTTAVGANNVATATLFLAQLTAVPIGTGDGQRIGDEIYPKMVELFISATNNAATRELNWRIIIFRWKQVSTISPSPVPADVCGSALSSITHDNRQVVEILYDSLIHVSDVNDRGFVRRLRIPLKYKRIDFQGASSTYAMNNVYLWAAHDSPNTEVLYYGSQLTFCDA